MRNWYLVAIANYKTSVVNIKFYILCLGFYGYAVDWRHILKQNPNLFYFQGILFEGH